MSAGHLTDGWEPDLPVSDTLLRPLAFDRPGATLDGVESFFDGQGTGEVYLWSAWPTPDLRPRGWELEGHPPLLVRVPGGRPPPPVPPGLRVERVTGVEGLRDWERVAVDGFPYRELQPYRPGCCWTGGSWPTTGCGCGSATSGTAPCAWGRCSSPSGWPPSRSG